MVKNKSNVAVPCEFTSVWPLWCWISLSIRVQTLVNHINFDCYLAGWVISIKVRSFLYQFCGVEKEKKIGALMWSSCNNWIKAAKDEIQKPSTCNATLFLCKFWSMFRVFHLAWSTWPATKTFVAGWRNAGRWLVDLLVHKHICCVTSCELDEKRATKPKFVVQTRPVLYFSQKLSSTRNKSFCCTTSWSCKVNNGRYMYRPKLATKQCCALSLGFFVSAISPPLVLPWRLLIFMLWHTKIIECCCWQHKDKTVVTVQSDLFDWKDQHLYLSRYIISRIL